MFKIIGKYALAVAVFGVSSGSFASGSEVTARIGDTPSISVGYADLNLATAEGVEALYARLGAAARDVCDQHEGRSLADVLEWRACYDQALSGAVTKVQSKPLSALHRATKTRQDLS